MATIGSLVISLEANMAKFTSDMDRAAKTAESAMDKVESAVEGAKHALEGLAAAFAIDKMVEFVNKGIESAASLEKLSAQTGISVESLSALRNVAVLSGTDFGQVAGAVDKLSKSMAGAQNGTGAAAQAFKALGLSVTDAAGHLKDPATMLQEIAKRLDDFKDGTAKNAVEMALFGRSGAEMALFLKQLAETGELNATVTGQQAEEAEKFQQKIRQLGIEFDTMRRNAILPLLPQMQGLTEAFADLVKNKDTVEAFTSIVSIGFRVIATGAVTAATIIGSIGERLVSLYNVAGQLAHGNISAAADEYKKGTAEIEKTAIAGQAMIDAIWAGPSYNPNPEKPKTGGGTQNLNFNPTTPVDRIKQQLAEQLKALNEQLKLEDELWKTADKKLDDDYKLSLVSLSDYGAQKIALLDKRLADSQQIYDQEIAAVESAIARETDANKRQEMIATLSETQMRKAQDLIKATADQAKAVEELRKASEEYAKQLTDLDVQYRLLIGDTEGATREQIAQADAMLRSKLEIEGNVDALAKLDALEKDRILRATNTPQAGMQRAASDYLKNINDIGKSFQDITTKMLKGVEDALTNFVMTGKLNFRSLIDSMIADLVRLSIQETIMKPLAQWFMGQVGGGGGILGSILGGGGGGMDPYAMATGTALGGAAVGGPAYAGVPMIVGERGVPEIFVPSSDGQILPSASDYAVSRGTTVHNYFTIQAPQGSVSRATQLQIAATAAMGVSRANLRNN